VDKKDDANLLKMNYAHYHRKAEGENKNIKVVVTGAI